MGFSILLCFLVGAAATLSGRAFFGPARTRVVITYGSQKLDFFSTKKTLSEALAEKGVILYPQDKTVLALNSALTGKAVKGSIDRSIPITIFDGYAKISGRSTSTEPAQILSDNNIKVWPEDKLSSELVLDPVSTQAVGLAVRIDRAPTYNVLVDNKKIVVRTWNPLVSEILKNSATKINPQDEVTPATTATLLPGADVVVTRVNEVDIPITSEVPFEVQNTTSGSVPFGQTQTIQAGANGIIQKTYHVVYKDGVEVSRWLISSVVTKVVQPKIIARGSISGRANFGYYEGMTTSFYKGYTGHHLLVTNLSNGKQVTVKIIGSGPFNGPLMDMGTDAFQAIGGSLSSGFIPSVSVVMLD